VELSFDLQLYSSIRRLGRARYTDAVPVPSAIEVAAVPPNNSTYSQAVRMGDLLFVSGQLGIDAATGALGQSIEEQTRQAIHNIRTILEAAGSALERVAKVNIYILDFGLLPRMNQVYGPFFGHRPAKTTVEVSRLDRDALIEIEVVAGI
jgi:2-iminobutanoate/2-iminopropanoate deaminase